MAKPHQKRGEEREEAGDEERDETPASQPRSTSASSRAATQELIDFDQDPAARAFEWVRERLNVIAAVLLLGTAIALVIIWRLDRANARDAEAWKSLAALPPNADPEAIQRLRAPHGDSSAAPYIALAYGNALYQRGSGEDLEAARSVFEELKSEYGWVEDLGRIADESIEAVDSELELRRSLPAATETISEEPAFDPNDFDPEMLQRLLREGQGSLGAERPSDVEDFLLAPPSAEEEESESGSRDDGHDHE